MMLGFEEPIKTITDIARGAEDTGRDPNSIAFPTAATVSVNQDRDLARDASRKSICKLYHPIPHPYYDSQLRQLGFEEFADQASQLMLAGKHREAMDLVPEEVIDTMTIPGTIEELEKRIHEYQGASDELLLARTSQQGDTRTLTD